MQTPDAVAAMKQDSHAQANHLPQILSRVVGQLGGRRPLLCCKPGNTQGIDRIGLGTRKFLFRKAVGAQRIDQGHTEALGHQERD